MIHIHEASAVQLDWVPVEHDEPDGYVDGYVEVEELADEHPVVVAVSPAFADFVMGPSQYTELPALSAYI